MFAVFAENGFGEEFSGRGFSPQSAWENMLTDFAVDESDIEMESVRFYVEVDVTRKTKVEWSEVSDTEDDTEE